MPSGPIRARSRARSGGRLGAIGAGKAYQAAGGDGQPDSGNQPVRPEPARPGERFPLEADHDDADHDAHDRRPPPAVSHRDGGVLGGLGLAGWVQFGHGATVPRRRTRTAQARPVVSTRPHRLRSDRRHARTPAPQARSPTPAAAHPAGRPSRWRHPSGRGAILLGQAVEEHPGRGPQPQHGPRVRAGSRQLRRLPRALRGTSAPVVPCWPAGCRRFATTPASRSRPGRGRRRG